VTRHGPIIDFRSSTTFNVAMPVIAGPAASNSIVGVPSPVSAVTLGVLLAVFVILAIIGTFVIIVVANRAEPDPSGRRPLVVYYLAVSFFAIFATLFATFAVVTSLAQLIGTNVSSSRGAIHPFGDAVARSVVLAGLIASIGVILLVTHLPRGLGLSGGADGRRGPSGRVAQSYAASVAFVAVAIASISAVVLIYEVARILGPGVFLLSGSRVDGLRILVPAGYVTLAAILLAVAHIRLLPPDVRGFVPFGRGAAPPVAPTPPGPAAPGPVVAPGAPPVASVPVVGPPIANSPAHAAPGPQPGGGGDPAGPETGAFGLSPGGSASGPPTGNWPASGPTS
jgi:hypothetical protein